MFALTAEAATGYKNPTIKIDNVDVTTLTVTKDVTIVVAATAKAYKLNATAGANTTLTKNPEADTYAYNAQVTLTAALAEGDYEWDNIPDGWQKGENDTYTLTYTILDQDVESGNVVETPTAKAKQQGWDVPSGKDNAPASEVFGDLPQELTNVPAKKLSDWATANGVARDASLSETVMIDAYLLNCAPTQEKVAEEKAQINIASIEFKDGKWVVTTVSGNVETQEFGNGKLVLEDVTESITGAAGSDAAKLWKMKLVPITAAE